MISPGVLKPKRALCGLVEGLPQPLGIVVGVEAVEGDRQLELVVLAEIAHLERAVTSMPLAVALRRELGPASSTSSP